MSETLDRLVAIERQVRRNLRRKHDKAGEAQLAMEIYAAQMMDLSVKLERAIVNASKAADRAKGAAILRDTGGGRASMSGRVNSGRAIGHALLRDD